SDLILTLGRALDPPLLELGSEGIHDRLRFLVGPLEFVVEVSREILVADVERVDRDIGKPREPWKVERAPLLDDDLRSPRDRFPKLRQDRRLELAFKP